MATATRSRRISPLAHRPLDSGADRRTASRRRATLVACGAYLLAAALSSLILVRILKLWHADLSVPIDHFWDAMLNEMWVKSVFEHGWYLSNPNLGAPGRLEMYDFPMADSLHLFVIKLLCLVSPNYVAAFNLYYLLGYPLTTLSAFFVLRRFAVSYSSALVASLLFTFLPYHFLRGQQHLFLGAYYIVPLSTMVALWLYLGLIGGPRVAEATAPADEKGRFAGSLAVAALQSCSGVYYAFFACFLLLVAGAAAALDTRRWRPAAIAALLIGVTAAGAFLNILPSVLHWRQHGANPAVAHRAPLDSDIHGLKIGQLLLPDSHHRISRWARVRQKYDDWPLAEGEKEGASLGIVGGVGFVFLIGSLLVRRNRANQREKLLAGLATLNVFVVLLATIGGFGSLFNFLINPQIRCYNRLSIFIGLFSLFAAAILLDRFAAWWTKADRPKWPLAALTALLAALGIVDAAGRDRVPNYALQKADFENDAEFVGRIEALLPEGAMVFQLPYYPFPESAPIHALGDYQLFRPYFHSSELRWSYGAMKGREADLWQRETSALPTADFVSAIAARGFSGIYIDRSGYADQGAALEAELTQLIGRGPIESGNGRQAFFASEGSKIEGPRSKVQSPKSEVGSWNLRSNADLLTPDT